MKNYRNPFWIAVAVSFLSGGCDDRMDSGYASDTELQEIALGIHERVLSVDTHDDIPFNFATPEVDPGVWGERQVTIPKMVEGGLDAAFFVVYVGQTERTPENYEKAKADAMTKFEAIHRMTDEMYPDRIELAYTASDFARIKAEGKSIAAIGIENGYVIGKDLSLIETYHDLGARYMTLAHGGHNDIADSSTPRENLDPNEEEHGGLSEFGEEVVAEMNRVGMLVDVSHISKKAMLHAIRVSRAPVIGSHSSVRVLRDHPRNMDDEQLLALRDNGGVIQIVALGNYVKDPPEEKQNALTTLFEEYGVSGSRTGFGDLSEEKVAEIRTKMAEIDNKWPGPNVSDFVDHIDYAVQKIGVEHVGMSSDFDGGGGIIGWNDASETFNVTLELVKRGYTEDQIEMLWGGNTLRILREAEQVAAEMQSEQIVSP